MAAPVFTKPMEHTNTSFHSGLTRSGLTTRFVFPETRRIQNSLIHSHEHVTELEMLQDGSLVYVCISVISVRNIT